MRKLTLKLVVGALLAIPAAGQAQTSAPNVSGRVSADAANSQAAPASRHRPSHRPLLSLRDHMNDFEHSRARATTATWLGIPAAEQATMSAQEWTEIDGIIDSANGQIHDRRTSAYMALRAATPEEVAQAGPNGRSCPAARTGEANGAEVASRSHRVPRSPGSGAGGCHWAFRSSN